MKKRAQTLWIAAAICCFVVIAAVLSAFLVVRKQHFSWNMQGVWVTADGLADDTVPFSAEGYVIDRPEDESDQVNMDYYFPGGSPYGSVSGTTGNVSYTQQFYNVDYFGCVAFSYDLSNEEMILVRYALDLDREYILLQWDDGSGRYLVAATDPDAEPTDIVAYFKEFVEGNPFD